MLIKQHGEETVDKACLIELGFPPELVTEFTEAMQVRTFIQSKEGQMRLGKKDAKSSDDLRGGDAPRPGLYHVVVNDIEHREQKVVAEFVILEGSVPGQKGKKHWEYFATSEKAIPRLTLFATVTGLLQPGEEKDVKLEEARGRQIVIELQENEYEGKKRNQITFSGMWELDHEKVKDVPKDKDAAEGAVEAAPAREEEPAKAAGSDDLWSDI